MSYFGKNLRRLREQNKLSQKELATKLNVSTSSVNMYESGKRNPTFDVVRMAARLFNVSEGNLLEPEDKKSRLEALEIALSHNEDFPSYRERLLCAVDAYIYSELGQVDDTVVSLLACSVLSNLNDQLRLLKVHSLSKII